MENHRIKLAYALRRLAHQLEKGLEKEAKKGKKKPGLSYRGWIARLKRKGAGKKIIDSFKGRWKGALEYADEKKKQKRFNSKAKREEYAARVAIDKLPKKYLDEPTPEHGPGKSGPIPGKKKK